MKTYGKLQNMDMEQRKPRHGSEKNQTWSKRNWTRNRKMDMKEKTELHETYNNLSLGSREQMAYMFHLRWLILFLDGQ